MSAQPGKCRGCSAELPPPKRTTGRKRVWCSSRCRKETLYPRYCEVCGTRISSSDGNSEAAPTRCNRHSKGNESKHQAKLARFELVAKLLTDGCTNAEIAEQLGITRRAAATLVTDLRKHQRSEGLEVVYRRRIRTATGDGVRII